MGYWYIAGGYTAPKLVQNKQKCGYDIHQPTGDNTFTLVAQVVDTV
jgi:hypothetical protein